MDSTPAAIIRTRRQTLRIVLTAEMIDALERRARRNDRFPWLEAGRIIRETLVRDGDLSAEAADR